MWYTFGVVGSDPILSTNPSLATDEAAKIYKGWGDGYQAAYYFLFIVVIVH